MRDADARAARYPFDPRDGVLASSLYSEAALCAGGGEDGQAASARAAAFHRRLEADYRAHRVALAVALEREDWAAVERDAGWIARLLPAPPAQYSAWLSEIRRRATREEHR